MTDLIFNSSHYTFNIYAMFPLMVGTFTLVIAFICLIHENYSLASKALFLLAMTLVLWLLNCGMIFLSNKYALALFWTKMEHLGVAFIPFAASAFTVVLVEKTKELKWFLISLFGFCLLSLVLVFVSDIFLKGLYLYPWGYYHQYGFFGIIFVLVFAISMITNLTLQWKKFSSSHIEGYRKRIKLLLIAYSIAYIGAIDFVPAYGIGIYPFGYLPIFIFLVLLTTAIWRYNLVDISPAIAAKKIILNMNDILIITDAKGYIRLMNPAAEQFFKVPERHAVNQHISQILPVALMQKTDRNTFIEDFKKLKNTEIHYQQKNGHISPLNLSSSILDNSSGNPLGVIFTAKDRTEYNQAIENIKKAYKTTQAILENIPVGIIILDFNKKIREINKAALQIMGLQNEKEAIGKLCDFKFIATKEYPHYPCIEKNMDRLTSEILIQGANDANITIRKTALKTNINGENVILEAFIDITKRIELEKQLHTYQIFLEEQVQERTGKLQEANKQLISEINIRKKIAKTLNENVEALETFQKNTFQRENDMINIKKIINQYCQRLNRPSKYNLSFLKEQENGS